MKTFHLDILTPFKKYLSQDITFMHVRNEDSVLGILPNHAPIITTVEICELILKVEDRETKYAISGGVLSLKDNKATLLVDAIERFDEIDIDRAKSSRARALERLKNKPYNKTCFDCGEKGTTYVSMSFGTFICSRCAGLLREMNFKVKGTGVSIFKASEVDFLEKMGNENAKAIWMAKFREGRDSLPSSKITEDVKKFLIDKYQEKKYYKKPKKSEDDKKGKGKKKEESDDEEEEEEEEEEEDKKKNKKKNKKSKKEESDDDEEEEEEEEEEEKTKKGKKTAKKETKPEVTSNVKLAKISIKKPTAQPAKPKKEEESDSEEDKKKKKTRKGSKAGKKATKKQAPKQEAEDDFVFVDEDKGQSNTNQQTQNQGNTWDNIWGPPQTNQNTTQINQFNQPNIQQAPLGQNMQMSSNMPVNPSFNNMIPNITRNTRIPTFHESASL